MAAVLSRSLVVLLGLFALTGPGAQTWAPAGEKIRTRWAEDVSPGRVWPEYPRPMLVRQDWKNLNGLWDYAITGKDASEPTSYDGRILVPFAVESSLSGVGRAVTPDQALWYKTSFDLPQDWKGRRVRLHFGAVDWDATVFVNGRRAGMHRGGYDPFTLDVSDLVLPGRPQSLVVRVWDPTDGGNSAQPRGKQVLQPGGIFYTAVTGIWQTVWLEPVPAAFLGGLETVPDVDRKAVMVTARVDGDAGGLEVLAEVRDGGKVVATKAGRPGEGLVLSLPEPRLWGPGHPFLYDLRVILRDSQGRAVDSVESYFGLRKISVGRDAEGFNRLFLNNEPLFQIGPLDQGWWPDGLYTAPTDAALRYDLEQTRALGFNMLRKHVKVEPQRLYYWADRLGLLVWQDMPSSLYDRKKTDPEALAAADRQWEAELKAMIDGLRNHPSIVMWVPFNEGWGQHETPRVAAWVKAYDPTRLVDNASGWTDEGAGDVRDIHSYPGPAMPPLEDRRAAVLGEFGGLGLPVKGHLWQEEGNWGYRSFDDFDSFRGKYI
ncbi:MAG: glycoside hydrolase family 2, partial [Candidatus Aminicenantes bacterium]|nr:glycoside hydrolase family 2 [Candidatus Aminicenantes bacterium]